MSKLTGPIEARVVFVALALLLAANLVGCGKNGNASAERAASNRWADAPEVKVDVFDPAANRATVDSSSSSQFTLLTSEDSGVDFANQLDTSNRREFIENGSGLAIGDYDQDGLPDLFFCSLDGANKLYRNLGNLRFEDVTQAAGILPARDSWSSGASFADVDNDTDLDLFVCHLNAKNQLFINDGTGKFREQGTIWGLKQNDVTEMVSFMDADNDGDLDVYTTTGRLYPAYEELKSRPKIRMKKGKPVPDPLARQQYGVIGEHVFQTGQRDLFYINENNKFIESSIDNGLEDFGIGSTAVWCDVNDDQRMDLYVSNSEFTQDRLYLNREKTGFAEFSRATLPVTPWFSMGLDFGDINNDGRVDWLVAGRMFRDRELNQRSGQIVDSRVKLVDAGVPKQEFRSTLLVGSGRWRYLEAAYLANLAALDWCWSVRLADLDGDGFQDVFATTGAARAHMDGDNNRRIENLKRNGDVVATLNYSRNLPQLAMDNLAFKNSGEFSFEEIGERWGLNLNGVSHGAAVADLDLDGDLDIVVNNLGSPASIYRNENPAGHRNLIFKLLGTKSNSHGLGAKVSVYYGDQLQVRQVSLTRGYMSSDDSSLHFGMNDVEQVDRVEIRWPSGIVQTLNDLKTNCRYEIRETESADDNTEGSLPAVLFQNATNKVGLTFSSQEMEFNDGYRNPMIPDQFSELGPGLAIQDFDQDGRNDVVIAGARGQSLAIFRQLEDGKFRDLDGAWREDFVREGIAPLILDTNQDDLPDILITSGSSCLLYTSPSPRDRQKSRMPSSA